MIPHLFRSIASLAAIVACFASDIASAQQPAPSTPGVMPPVASSGTGRPAVRQLAAVAHEPILVSHQSAVFGVMRVDEGMERLMACHPASGRLTILNLANHTIKNLPVGQVDGLAIDVEENKIFTSGPSVTIGVLDRKSLVRIDTLVLGAAGGRMIYDPDDHEIFVAHDDSAYLWVIDARLHLLVGKIKLDGAPARMAFDPVLHQVLATIQGADRVDIIDARKQTMTAGWDTAPVDGPTGIAVDPQLHLTFVVGSNGKLDVFDTRSGQIVGSADIAADADEIAYDGAGQRLFCASGVQGVISVVQIGQDGSAATMGQVSTHSAAGTLAITASKSGVDIWVGYPAADGSYLQCFSLAR